MTDESTIESLAKALHVAAISPYSWVDLNEHSRRTYRCYARAALTHLGEQVLIDDLSDQCLRYIITGLPHFGDRACRSLVNACLAKLAQRRAAPSEPPETKDEQRGISFEGMSDELLDDVRVVLFDGGCMAAVAACDAELARRNPPEPAKDEWREDMVNRRDFAPIAEARLRASQAEQRAEAAEKDARSWKFVAECERRANAKDRQRAEATEVKLKQLVTERDNLFDKTEDIQHLRMDLFEANNERQEQQKQILNLQKEIAGKTERIKKYRRQLSERDQTIYELQIVRKWLGWQDRAEAAEAKLEKVMEALRIQSVNVNGETIEIAYKPHTGA